MEKSNPSQNRRSRRKTVLLNASIDLSGHMIPARVRNLSAEGVLIEANQPPVEGTEVIIRKGGMSLAGRVAWVDGNRAGLAIADGLAPERVLRPMGTPLLPSKPIGTT